MYSPKRYPPAGARDQRSLPCSCWDFPRIRGEKLQLVSMPMRAVGSPPHTRGKEKELQHIRFLKGITPAYAGKRRRLSAAPRFSRDHPRIRGEKIIPGHGLLIRQGSPPHTRGKEGTDGFLGQKTGITPAYAGKRVLYHVPRQYIWDHPRIRGEKWTPHQGRRVISGSPPHTRGKAIGRKLILLPVRITPAYAGKSTPAISPVIMTWDHPRIRGEKDTQINFPYSWLGSPPHTRGKAGHSE